MEERVRGRGEEHTLSALVFFSFFHSPFIHSSAGQLLAGKGTEPANAGRV